MNAHTWTKASLRLAILALGLALAACGGGGSQDGNTGSVTANPSHGPELPDPAAPGGTGSTPLPTPGTPTVPEPDVPAPDPDPATTPETPDATPPDEPAPLAVWNDLHDIHALALDPAASVLWAVSSETGEVYRIDVDGQEEPALAATLGMRGVRALAFHTGDSVLYAVRESGPGESDVLLRIDPRAFPPHPEAYEATVVAPLEGHTHVESLAYHATHGKLYAVDTDQDLLLAVEPSDGRVDQVGSVGRYGDIVGLAPEPQGDGLIGTDRLHRALVTIDVETAHVTRRARHPDQAPDALAADPAHFPLYASNAAAHQVFAFDPLGERWAFADILGLAHDPGDGRTFGVHPRTGEILKIDPDTKSRVQVGFVPAAGLAGLAFDPQADALYAISSVTQELFVLAPETAVVRERKSVHGAAAPFAGLRSLASAPGALFSVDVATGRLLTISPGDGHAIVVGSTAPYDRIEGLAYDPRSNALHAYCDQNQAYILLDTTDPTLAVPIAGGITAHMGGLSWNETAQILLGTDLPGNDLVRVNPVPEPSPLGYEHLAALAHRGDGGPLLAFDRATATLLEVDAQLQLGVPMATHEGVALEGMTYDSASSRMLAVDAEAGSLYAVELDGALSLLGIPGALKPYRVKALAFDPGRHVVFGVDDETDVLVTVDANTGAVTVVNPVPPGLGHASIESLAFDATRDRLLGVDRVTRTLVEIDRDTGAASKVADLDVPDVTAMATFPGSNTLWLASGLHLFPVDPANGEPVDETLDLAKADVPAAANPVRLLWPRGDVSRDALASCAVEVEAGHEGALGLELRCGDHILHTSALEPDGALARFELPGEVREVLDAGETIVWRVGNVSASFRVRDGAEARADIRKVLAHKTMADRTDWERRLVEGWVLDRAGLHTEALVVGIGTYEAYPDRPTSARALLRTLEHLGLVQTRLGRKARMGALTP